MLAAGGPGGFGGVDEERAGVRCGEVLHVVRTVGERAPAEEIAVKERAAGEEEAVMPGRTVEREG